jgi:hypothetical protein
MTQMPSATQIFADFFTDNIKSIMRNKVLIISDLRYYRKFLTPFFNLRKSALAKPSASSAFHQTPQKNPHPKARIFSLIDVLVIQEKLYR